MASEAKDDAAAKAALNETLKEYINEWRKTREKEEEELKKLKEKQAKRKEIRAEQDAKMNQQKKRVTLPQITFRLYLLKLLHLK